MTAPALAPSDVTLGILAGGLATRLGGRDKAWLERDGMPQVLRWRRRFQDETSAVLVSANRDLDRYAAHELRAVPDRQQAGAGPVAGLEALAAACATPWLLTLPVDLFGVNDCLLPTLAAERGADGAWAQDGDGPQPLVALWRVQALRDALATLPAAGGAVRELQAHLDMPRVSFGGVRFGNLNTPRDLDDAGIAHE
jgi:molybdopterin-guanine dinucleotide biosynthesis protein A